MQKISKLGISEEPQLIGQVGVSPLAYISILCGLVSLVALISLKLVLVPVIAAALCVAFYLRIVQSDSTRGSGLALVGLGIAFFAGSWTISGNAIRFQKLTKTAGGFAEDFVNRLASGDTSDALQLTLRIDMRPIAGTNLDDFFKNREDSKQFLELAATQLVINSGTNSKWEFVQGQGMNMADRSKGAVRVLLQNKNAPSEQVVVVLVREVVENSRESQVGWHVAKLELPK